MGSGQEIHADCNGGPFVDGQPMANAGGYTNTVPPTEAAFAHADWKCFGKPDVEATYRYYRIAVSQNAGATYWCLEELSFYGDNGQRLTLDKSFGSAETIFDHRYTAEMAFNAIS